MRSGITLIALVVTICVLLILVGITINTLIGENGIITKAIEAKELAEKSTALEDIQLAYGTCEVEYTIYGSEEERYLYFTEQKLNDNFSGGIIVEGTFNYDMLLDTISFTYKNNINTEYLVFINANGEITIEENGSSGEKATLDLEKMLDENFNDLTSNIKAEIKRVEKIEQDIYVTGEVVSEFELKGNALFSEAEVTMQVNTGVGTNNDVLALYQWKNDQWEIIEYCNIVNQKITFTVNELSKIIIVNKSRGNNNINEISTIEEALIQDGAFKLNGELEIDNLYIDNSSNKLELHDTQFVNAGDGTIEIANTNTTKNYYFSNCTFDNVKFSLKNQGNYIFNNCTFNNNTTSPIEMLGDNISVYLLNSEISNNKPDLEEWNSNENNVRSWKYSAVNLRANNLALHMNNSTINNFISSYAIFVEKNHTNTQLYVDYSKISNVEGNAISMQSETKGRIANNGFENIGELRGKNGYASDGTGVGGNAIYSENEFYNTKMRIYNNVIKNVMENGIEGTYYCVNNNHIENTGYRYNEGYTTPSTEGIYGGSYSVKDNVITKVHGRGIIVTNWQNQNIEISNNSIDKQGINVAEDFEGIRLIIRENNNENVTISGNDIKGFVNKYRILNDYFVMCKNLSINDTGTGKLIGSVYSSLTGVNISSDRQKQMPFANINFQLTNNDEPTDWLTSNKSSFKVMSENNESFARFVGLNDVYGRVYQRISLPKQTSIVCLKLVMRSSSDTVNIQIHSQDENGNVYPTGDGGVYSRYKIPIKNVKSDEFDTYYVCFKALDISEISVMVNEPNQTIDLQSIEGYYMVDNE